jgi:quinol monooxygenase YgiN
VHQNEGNTSEVSVDTLALLALLRAKPGKEAELEQFLKSAQPLAAAEPGTSAWYAVKIGPDRFGIFDTFRDEAGREAHLGGEIAKALFAHADELLAESPQIEKLEILAAKTLPS